MTAPGLLAAGVLLNAPEPFRGDDPVDALAYVRWLEAELALAQRIMLGAIPADVPFAERCADCREADQEDWAKETGPCPVCGHDGR